MNLGAPTGTPARLSHALGQTGMKTNDNFPQVVASQRLAISELEDLSPRAAGRGKRVSGRSGFHPAGGRATASCRGPSEVFEAGRVVRAGRVDLSGRDS